ncbi:hypothetical protein B9Z55_020625 [Caenorhabditis nigoni]|uniref:Uncharacterized protein n=1 Tax=Caenorhabditis nigoni TaxID=1611254 RepID=A0A2G5TNM0_9PELO|nr:hypothetical protein B9Z55_020625 [Caenorhabditis nigoni]
MKCNTKNIRDTRSFNFSNLFFTEEQANAELTADGMTQPSIDGLAALTQRFATGFPLETTDAHNFIKSMPENDQSIYNTYLKKYGLA